MVEILELVFYGALCWSLLTVSGRRWGVEVVERTYKMMGGVAKYLLPRFCSIE